MNKRTLAALKRKQDREREKMTYHAPLDDVIPTGTARPPRRKS